MTIWWLLTRELINCSHVTFQKHNCKDVYAKFQLTSEEALINVSISSPKFCFLLSSDHSCYCNRRLIDEQHSTSEYGAGLTYSLLLLFKGFTTSYGTQAVDVFHECSI